MFSVYIQETLKRYSQATITAESLYLIDFILTEFIRVTSKLKRDIVQSKKHGVVREKGRRNPTSDSLRYMITFLMGPGTLKKDLLKQIKVADEISRRVHDVASAQAALESFHTSVPFEDVFRAYNSQFDRPIKTKPSFRIALVLLVTYLLDHAVDRLSATARYKKNYTIELDDVCLYVSNEPGLAKFMYTCVYDTLAVSSLGDKLQIRVL